MPIQGRTGTSCLVTLALAAGLCGCGTTAGGGPGARESTGRYGESATAAPLLDETGGEIARQTEEEPERRATGSGTGRLRVKITRSGEAGTGHVRVVSSSKQLVAEGPSSQTFEVPSGEYELQVRLDEALDRPEKSVPRVRVPAGETAVQEVAFTVGQVKLQPRVGQRPVGSQIRWRYAGGGDWFEQPSQVGEEVVLSAGRYDAEVMVNRRAITIEDIQVYEGRRTISPEVHMR